MENHAAVVDYEPALRAGEPRLLGFLLPRLRDHRLRAAVYVGTWGIAGLLSTTVSGLDTNTDHVMLYFIFLMIGVILLQLAVAAADQPWAERAAALLEGRLRAMLAID